MTKSKITKRALFASVLSMMLCVAMLIGTTFAWFTDSVNSGKNRIAAGVLDVELFYKTADMVKNDKDYRNVKEIGSDEQPFFLDKDGNAIKWEPGVVAYTYFKVENVANLALTYQLKAVALENAFNTLTKAGSNEPHNLKEVIKFAVLDGEVKLDGRDDEDLKAITDTDYKDFESFERNGRLFPAEAVEKDETGTLKSCDIFTVVAYWKPNTAEKDNLYNANNGDKVSDYDADEDNNYLWLDIDVQLTATQTPFESDSFNKDYDENIDPSTGEKIFFTGGVNEWEEGEGTGEETPITPVPGGPGISMG